MYSLNIEAKIKSKTGHYLPYRDNCVFPKWKERRSTLDLGSGAAEAKIFRAVCLCCQWECGLTNLEGRKPGLVLSCFSVVSHSGIT